MKITFFKHIYTSAIGGILRAHSLIWAIHLFFIHEKSSFDLYGDNLYHLNNEVMLRSIAYLDHVVTLSMLKNDKTESSYTYNAKHLHRMGINPESPFLE